VSAKTANSAEASAKREGLYQAAVAELGRALDRVAAGYEADPAKRLDLRQEIHLQLWRAFPRYDPERRFSTWMYRIALNVAISWRRRVTTRARRTVPLEGAGPPGTPARDPADPRAEPRAPEPEEERARALHEVIARLDPLNRALMILYLDDLGHAEIADVLGLSASNVGTKIHRLKQRIRAELAAPGT
jgi:RNA polymerase sigma-70 factor (ECF subfamily)